MLKKLWLKMRFLNIWSWAQIGIMLFNFICFSFIMFNLSKIIDAQTHSQIPDVVNIGINNSMFRTFAVAIWVLAILLSITMILGLRKLNSMIMDPIRQVIDGAMKLAQNELSYRVPTGQALRCYSLTDCNKLGCALHGQRETACWLSEDSLCVDNGATFEEKLEKCKRCTVYRAYASNETNQLVATFNFMADKIDKQTRQLTQRHNELARLVDELSDYESVIFTLALAVEAKDTYTLGHSERVSKYALALGEKIGLDDSELENLRIGTLLHDIGKIAIRDDILRKPSSLTQDEFRFIKEHPQRGESICSNLTFAKDSLTIILHHHERFDGKGYPHQLEGFNIPLLVRITTIADAFDAMTSDRPYRPGMSLEQAIKELRNNAGAQFDTVLVEDFIELLTSGELSIITEIGKQYSFHLKISS